MRLGTRLERIGSLPRVLGACQDSAREFVERRPRLAGRLSGVSEKLEVDLWPCIKKIARNTLGDRQRKTVRLIAGNAGGCRIVGVRS
ncbi:hypothetical protein GW17_00058718 [Ensete ventricosum]|uniref:Uncharacterized protein n=1 Tax=Ensete ventricosum TaxID=4639 RepID=A0A444C2F5_ENSVE|nr:hypothetical protein GW17_00058718 [Ensete ventricosum]RZR70754.1 hypothetical protein BHM03_00001282 [Ensete ventricosum]